MCSAVWKKGRRFAFIKSRTNFNIFRLRSKELWVAAALSCFFQINEVIKTCSSISLYIRHCGQRASLTRTAWGFLLVYNTAGGLEVSVKSLDFSAREPLNLWASSVTDSLGKSPVKSGFGNSDFSLCSCFSKWKTLSSRHRNPFALLLLLHLHLFPRSPL